MASEARLAKLHAHIALCHNAVLPGPRLRLYAGAHHIGYVKPGLAAQLAMLCPEAIIAEDRMNLTAEALPMLNTLARGAGLRFRNENFDVRETLDGPVLGVLDRGALPGFGVIGVGVHLNGLVHLENGPYLWVAKRAADKKLDPGKLDHLVAGGVPAGLTPFETLVKEAAEEAALPAALAAQAREVGRFTYNMERTEGLRRDAIFAYDLDLPEDFEPAPADGEVESFALWPLTEVLEVLSTTDDFKFNVTLVLIDLCIRHGLITGQAAASLRAALHPKTPES